MKSPLCCLHEIKHEIKEILPGSIAQELEIEPGDRLLSINNKSIADVLDYRFMTYEEELTLEVEKPDGEIWELEIEKDESEDIGLVFESGLMDEMRICRNRCIFCFMDQLPKDMRKSLYLKDDDIRLSFLSGNYVTLTNLSEGEADRIARYHLSPLHISVHAADSGLRRKMLNNADAGRLFEHLRIFKDAGITMHFQIVLCKGINDGAALDATIGALFDLGSGAGSISVVPAGLTKHREGLYPLEPFSREDAAAVIGQVERWNAQVYCADEWYIRAGLTMPAYGYYGDFPQLENGVGMCAMFERECSTGQRIRPVGFGIVTGEAAQGLIRKIFGSERVYVVRNDFFGHTITVSGLLTGRDIVAQVGEKARQDGCAGLVLPENMFRAGTEIALDDMTRGEIEGNLGVPVRVGI